MQMVVILFVGILSVVRATPFAQDRRTAIKNVFRVEQDEFSNIGDNYGNAKFITGSNPVAPFKRPLQGLHSLLGSLEFCGFYPENAKPEIPEKGCVYFADGNVNFARVLSEVNLEDVYTALEGVDIAECDLETNSVPNEGCFFIDEGSKTLQLSGIYNDHAIQEIADVSGNFKVTKTCDVNGFPNSVCFAFEYNAMGFLNVLNEDNIDNVVRDLNGLGFVECVIDKEHGLVTTSPCYRMDERTKSIIFINVNKQNINENNRYIDNNHDKGDYEFLTEILLKRQSSDAYQAKDVLKKIKQRQKALQKRTGQQDCEKKIRGRVKPKWMKYFQTIA